MKKHVHFIGIAGKTTAPLAKMFKDLGWQVTGSDHAKTYPPISTYLTQNKISYAQGYSEKNLVGPPRLGEAGRPDLVVVGRSALLVDPQNPEYLKAKKLGLKILSHPEVLREYVVKGNSIVVAGTYGKTTTSALMSWILEKAGFNPSFMIGGIPLNFPDGVRSTRSLWSVVEGDEPPAMKETDPPKFMFYQPKYVLLTACQWDHPEVFRREKKYIETFKKFIKLVPNEGLLVACREGKNNQEAARVASCPVVWYSKERDGADFWVENVQFESDFTRFEVVSKDKKMSIESRLLGWHNIQNVCGAAALCLNLGITPRIIKQAVKSFRGVKTRLEFVGEFGGMKVFWDFAQHPVKVKETLTALRTRYQKERIIAVFDPHQTMLQNRESLAWYPGSFDQADEVLVCGVSFSKAVPKEDRVTGKDIAAAIKKTQPGVKYFPIEGELIDYLVKNSKPGSLIIFMSSGGQRVPRMIERVKG